MHAPTEQTKAVVLALASYGIPHTRIADYIGISKNTLYNHYRPILDTAQVDKVLKVANCLFGMATEEKNVTAMIFFLKTQGSKFGWREVSKDEEEETVSDSISEIRLSVIK